MKEQLFPEENSSRGKTQRRKKKPSDKDPLVERNCNVQEDGESNCAREKTGMTYSQNISLYPSLHLAIGSDSRDVSREIRKEDKKSPTTKDSSSFSQALNTLDQSVEGLTTTCLKNGCSYSQINHPETRNESSTRPKGCYENSRPVESSGISSPSKIPFVSGTLGGLYPQANYPVDSTEGALQRRLFSDSQNVGSVCQKEKESESQIESSCISKPLMSTGGKEPEKAMERTLDQSGEAYLDNLGDLMSNMSMDECCKGENAYDDDPTHLSVFEVNDPSANRNGTSKSANNSMNSNSPENDTHTSNLIVPPTEARKLKSYIEDLQGFKDEFDSDITELSFSVSKEHQNFEPMEMSCRANHTKHGKSKEQEVVDKDISERNGIKFKPHSFSTPFENNSSSSIYGLHTQRSEFRHDTTGKTETQLESDINLQKSQSILSLGTSVPLGCTSEDSDATRLDSQLCPELQTSQRNSIEVSGSTEFCASTTSTRLESTFARLQSCVNAQTPHREVVPHCGNIQSILKKRCAEDDESDQSRRNLPHTLVPSARKQLSKSVTFSVPLYSSDESSKSSSILAPETPMYLWHTIPFQRALINQDSNSERLEYSMNVCDDHIPLTTQQEVFTQSDQSHSENLLHQLHGSVSDVEESQELEEDMSILAMETPQDLWISPPFNFINNTLNINN